FGFKRQQSTGTVKTNKVYGPGGKFMIGPDFGFKTFQASAHFVNFNNLEVYTWNKLEFGFKRQQSTGTVKTNKVYGPGGKFMIGPDFGFKTFQASAHFVNFNNLEVYTWNKLEIEIDVSFQYFLRKDDLPYIHKFYDVNYGTTIRTSAISAIKSVLLYGCEAWNASTMCIKRIQVFINRCLRRILRIKWTDKISNESLWERTRQIPAGDEIGRRRWRWIGHTLRKPCGSITKNVLDWNPQGKRSRGRPRGTWRRVRDNDVKTETAKHETDHFISKRKEIEAKLFKAVRDKLGGTCCEKGCEELDGGCPEGCKGPDDCNDEEDKGLWVNVKYFQLGAIQIPDVVEERKLEKLITEEAVERGQYLQDASVIRKNTEAIVRDINNQAEELRQRAETQSQQLRIISQANYTAIVEKARSKGLKDLYDQLGIKDQAVKSSFDYLRTLRGLDHVHLTVDFQQRIVGGLGRG
ncbi:hypothetical protein ElyMa_006699500, partial [Elysia marginata]